MAESRGRVAPWRIAVRHRPAIPAIRALALAYFPSGGDRRRILAALARVSSARSFAAATRCVQLSLPCPRFWWSVSQGSNMFAGLLTKALLENRHGSCKRTMVGARSVRVGIDDSRRLRENGAR